MLYIGTDETDAECVSCGELATASCEECGSSRCQVCNDQWHKHPKRRNHEITVCEASEFTSQA